MPLSPTQLEAFAAELDALEAKYGESIGGSRDTTLGTILEALAQLVERDKTAYLAKGNAHDVVVALLDNVVEGLRHSALDYYCSFK